MARTSRKWFHLAESNVLAASGDATLDAYYRRRLFSAETGCSPILMLYDSDVTAGGTPLRTGLGTASSAIDATAFVTRIGEAMAVAGTPRPFTVILDFEQDFYGWLNGYGTLAQENRARDQHVAAIAAARAAYGSAVRFGLWGLPLIHYTDYRSADDAGKATLRAAAQARFAPMFADVDILMPSAYELWPVPGAMDPAVRPWVVRATAAEGNGLTPAQFKAKWEEGMTHHLARIQVAKAIDAAAGRSRPLYVSQFGYYSSDNSLAFGSSSEGSQFVPDLQLRAWAQRIMPVAGVTGVNWWWPASYFLGAAFVADGSSSANVRNGIVDAFYKGASPVPSRYPSWTDAAFKRDFAVVWNERVLWALRMMREAGADRHSRIERRSRRANPKRLSR